MPPVGLADPRKKGRFVSCLFMAQSKHCKHPEVKPTNLVSSFFREVNLRPFVQGNHTLEQYWKSYGTIDYCAPELLSHQEHDESCDIYSFGIIMHELFTLAAPYSPDSYSSVFTLGLDIERIETFRTSE